MKDWREDTNWRRLGDVVGRLKEQVEAAYYHGREGEASAAHDDLVSAEWRMRQAERLAERRR